MNSSIRVLFLIILLFALLLSSISGSKGQSLVQTIRGQVMDRDSRYPVIGATVVIVDVDPIQGAVTDEEGHFRIEKVALGRIALRVSCVGYAERTLSNILLTSGKELVMEIFLEESVERLQELVIRSNDAKHEVSNEMALTSARTFTVEETKRYAGSFNDPARMVSAYAGINVDAGGDNMIVVRGNSPKGVQWRLDGIEIPNPNHFSEEGATGGAINILNSQMLDNSEFYSGAFAPEFGNALSGIYDMKLRKGNNQTREYSVTAGIIGLDLSAEGPIGSKSGASYLINYRYSTLSILSDLGLVDFDGIPKYEDISFKVYIPAKGAGQFSLFGLGGKSHILETYYDEQETDKVQWEGDYRANMGVIGLRHQLVVGKNTYLENSISLSQNGSGYFGEEPVVNREPLMREAYYDNLNKRSARITSSMHHKINARHKIQAGAIYTHHFYDFYSRYYDHESDTYIKDQDTGGNTGHLQGFLSWKYKPLPQFSIVGGLHSQTATINFNMTVEPRLAMRWEFRDSQAVTLGLGVHSKMESLPNYFVIKGMEDGSEIMPNKNMRFSKANHYVIGYENRINPSLFFKTELYYQKLYQIPVEDDPFSSYSLINQVEGYADRVLVNEGKGVNYGMEVTVERYFEDNYYFMVTGSLFNSTYTALDGIRRSTRFNGHYIGNFLIGKEFVVGRRKERSKIIGLNAKVSVLGARRFTPIDLDRSVAEEETVRMEQLAFSQRGDDVFIANIALSYRVETKRTSQELKLDIQNVTNNQAMLDQYYNSLTQKIEYVYQLPMLPVIMYTIHF